MELVTVARFRQGLDAHLCRSFLESEQIPAVLANEYVVGVNWLYSDAIGGVEVQVESSKAESAFSKLKIIRSPTAGSRPVPLVRILGVLVVLSVAAMAIPLLIVAIPLVVYSRRRQLVSTSDGD